MDSETQPRASTATEKMRSSSPNPPRESAGPAPDLIWTPEKPLQLPRRARNRSVAFSVKEVRRVALGLQKPATPSDLARPGADLSSIEEHLGDGFGTISTPKSSKANTLIKLPEKYEILCEFFNCLESSIRLLRLKGSMPTFANICTSIQHLTERRFTYVHLAQLKYILPEAIMIKKVLLHNEASCCMKPELQVTLQVDAVAKNIKGKSESGYSILRTVFRERLANFFKDHPEGDEVPEEQLPHPFNQRKSTIHPSLNTNSKPTCTESSASTASQKLFVVPSHMPESFQRRFSRKLLMPDLEKTSVMCLSEACPKDALSVSVASSPMKYTSKPPKFEESLLNPPISTTTSSKYGSGEEETGQFPRAGNYSHEELKVQEGTPAKQVSTPLRLMANTPDISTPKRIQTTSTCDSPPLNKCMKRSTRTKLFLTPKKSANSGNEDCEDRKLSANDDILNILPESLLQSIREKEQKAVQEKEAGVADAIRRQKLIASLPNVFDMILLTFQSWKRSVMTKHELIHKLISSHCKIVDRGEMEEQFKEQFKLLLELVPEWISEKISFSGDILCHVSKTANPDEIRRRLAEAE